MNFYYCIRVPYIIYKLLTTATLGILHSKFLNIRIHYCDKQKKKY